MKRTLFLMIMLLPLYGVCHELNYSCRYDAETIPAAVDDTPALLQSSHSHGIGVQEVPGGIQVSITGNQSGCVPYTYQVALFDQTGAQIRTFSGSFSSPNYTIDLNYTRWYSLVISVTCNNGESFNNSSGGGSGSGDFQCSNTLYPLDMTVGDGRAVFQRRQVTGIDNLITPTRYELVGSAGYKESGLVEITGANFIVRYPKNTGQTFTLKMFSAGCACTGICALNHCWIFTFAS